MIYDIRTKSAACDTLLNMTEYSETFWELKIIREGIGRFQTIPDDFFESEIGKYPFGNNPEKYKEMTLKISHFTTSDDNCESIGKYGLLDLGSTYQCKESDLRRFLDDHHIYIDLNSKKLIYSTTEYDITYHHGFQTSDEETVEYLCNEIGRKFYLDFAINGFFTIPNIYNYSVIAKSPEIIWNIDRLLNIGLVDDWRNSHCSYEIALGVHRQDLVYNQIEEGIDGEAGKIMEYIREACDVAVYGCLDEIRARLKDGVSIPSKYTYMPKKVDN